MATFNDIEIGLLQQACSAAPHGIPGARDHDSAEYAALVRLLKAGLLEAEDTRTTYRGVKGPDYDGVNITEQGRAVLDDHESSGERTAYVNVILIVLANPKVQLQSEDVERIKAAVQRAPLAKLREVVGWFGTVVTLADFGTKLVAAFLVG